VDIPTFSKIIHKGGKGYIQGIIDEYLHKAQNFEEEIKVISEQNRDRIKEDLEILKNSIFKKMKQTFWKVEKFLLENFESKKKILEENLKIAKENFLKEREKAELFGLENNSELVSALSSSMDVPEFFANLSREYLEKIENLRQHQNENIFFNHYTKQFDKIDYIEGTPFRLIRTRILLSV
jgi:hypothetical protein